MPPEQANHKATSEFLTGLVERVTFHNPENGFAVLRLKPRGAREPVTVIGYVALVAPGEFVEANGAWEQDLRHGLQFHANFLKTAPPTSEEGIARYLGSGMIHGVGPVYAKRLLAHFGVGILDLLDHQPERLREVPGIGPKRLARIRDGWAEQKAVRDIMIFLHDHGVGTARSVRIYKTYGADAVRLIREDPYRLARDIRGIGFRSADTIAAKLGMAKTAPSRVRAGIAYALQEAMDEGHCGLPRARLLELAAPLIEVPAELIEQALASELAVGHVVADTLHAIPAIFLAGLYQAEREIAARLRALARGALPWRVIDAAKALPWVERKTGLTLSASQRDAVEMALTKKLLVITGGPGVGKTTLVNVILAVLRAKSVRIALAAPTGRAAKRLAEATGLEAKTVHRLLEANPGTGKFRRDETAPLACDLLVLDEASMVDVPMMRALLRAVPERAGVLIVGDVDQIPSVGPGEVLEDIITADTLPIVRLREIFRQAEQSGIVRAAHRINRGVMPSEGVSESAGDFYFVAAASPDEIAAKLLRIVTERIPKQFGLDPIRDVQVLCPMNRGQLGARALNLALQGALNPPSATSVERFGAHYGPGDKVMQTENDYTRDVFNGDLGFVRTVDREAGEAVVAFDGRDLRYSFSELDELQLAYATTIHKSQGSEYPAVVIPLTMQHYTMLMRNLLYTGVTRGRRLVVLIGERRALAVAVKNHVARARFTKLGEWLGAGG